MLYRYTTRPKWESISLADRFVFTDEAGCFSFHCKKGASKYFLLCTITLQNCDISGELLNIKRRLVASGEPDRDKLHATTDSVPVRNEVYAILEQCDLRIDCTILEKRKAQPQTRVDELTFYRFAWYYHFKHVGPRICAPNKKTLITTAALGDRKKRAAFKTNVNNVVQQIVPRNRWEVSFIDSSQDPCLWAADYCAWAIQRKWEMGESHFYDKIKSRIVTEFDLWAIGTKTYY